VDLLTKTCPKCKLEKNLSEFHKDKTTLSGLHYRCKDCKNSYTKRNYQSKKESDPQFAERCRLYSINYYHKTKHLKKWKTRIRAIQANIGRKCRYGITVEHFNQLLKMQNGLCAICGQPSTARDKFGKIRSLGVDHDHKTGKLRGLLCSNCNTGLGQFREKIKFLEKAIEYLKKHSLGEKQI